jgi:hypothetical protein
VQEVSNMLAKLSIRACARLGGYLNGDLVTPDNPAVKKSLMAMLTPYLARKLSEDKPEEVGTRSLQKHLHLCSIQYCLVTSMSLTTIYCYYDAWQISWPQGIDHNCYLYCYYDLPLLLL